jgi:flagellar biosynthetic protein FlhB
MAEQSGEKTEAPTPRRRQEALDQGQIPRSADLTAATLLLSVIFLLQWAGPGLVSTLKGLIEQAFSPEFLVSPLTGSVPSRLLGLLSEPLSALVPLFGGLMLVALLVNVAQVGLRASPKRLAPKLSSLSPMKGIKRLFGGGNGWASIVMSMGKLLLVSAAAYSAIHGRLPEIVAAQLLSFQQIFGLGCEVFVAVALRIAVVLLVLAILDYAWQRFRVEKQLRMTKQEVKEEMKRMEGDPHIKARRRQIAMQRVLQRINKDVPGADVVVTNPTEFAVAIRYDAATMNAPKVVAKGRGYIAQRIRDVAAMNGVPILERPPLARALFRLVEVGQEIPEQFYNTVAEILAYVYEISGRMKTRTAEPV